MLNLPNVLLLGNGLNRSFSGGAWDDLIRKISVRDDLPERMNLTMPLQVILATNGHVSSGMKNVRDELKGCKPEGEYLQMLQKLLSAGFTDILTTNYSYEIEQAARPETILTDYQLRKLSAHTKAVDKAEPRYLLHTFNHVDHGGISNRIWHIHGEARKPEGMIIGHYYYASLLTKMKQYSDKRGSDYLHCVSEGMSIPTDSWLDSFIMGNVYVLGFGFDQSEFDLWWLLNRKQREKAPHGQVYFYEPSGGNDFDARKELLKVMNVQLVDLGVQLSSDEAVRNLQFRGFYERAIHDINTKVQKGGNG